MGVTDGEVRKLTLETKHSGFLQPASGMWHRWKVVDKGTESSACGGISKLFCFAVPFFPGIVIDGA